MAERRPWTQKEILTLRMMHAQNMSDGLIAAKLERLPNSVWAKRWQLGLHAVDRNLRVVGISCRSDESFLDRAEAAKRMAERDQAAGEGRDLTGVFCGDPQPWRSALAQRATATETQKITHASAGMLTRFDSVKRNEQFVSTRSFKLARREREARA